MAIVERINFAREGSPLDFASQHHAARLSGNLKAAETLTPGTLVHINADGQVAVSDGSIVHGIVVNDALAGEEVTIFQEGTRLRYSSGGLTPGQPLYAAADGALDTAATSNDSTGVAIAVSANDIQFTRVKLAADAENGG